MKREVYRVSCDLCGRVAEDDQVDGWLSVQTMLGPTSSRKLQMEARAGGRADPVPSGEFCSLAHLSEWAAKPLAEVMAIVEETNRKEHEGHDHPDVATTEFPVELERGYA